MDHKQVISKIDDKLVSQNFKVWRNITIEENKDIAIFATKINWLMFRLPCHLFVDYLDSPTIEDFEKFYPFAIDYSKRSFTRGIKIPFSSLGVVICFLCNNPSQELIEYVEKRNFLWSLKMGIRMHGLDLYPVIVDLESEKTYYWKGYNYVGCAVWGKSRKLINSVIIPSVVKD